MAAKKQTWRINIPSYDTSKFNSVLVILYIIGRDYTNYHSKFA